MRRHAHKFFLYLAALLLFAACATLEKPQSVEDSVFYAQAQVGAAYGTIADLRKRGQITPERRDDLVARVDGADEAIKAARAFARSGDAAGARSALATATAILIEIERIAK